MIEIGSLHHISIPVTNLEKAKQFYGEVIGLEEIQRPDFGFPGAWYQVGDQQIHLIVHAEEGTFRPNSIDTRDIHFALRVKDYNKTLAYLKEKNIEIVDKPKSKSGFAQIFCKDPDNNLIELNVDQ